jgi:MYXO-CTERM domain-containing protein
MKKLSFLVALAGMLTLAAPASADVIVDCSGQPEGNICTTPDGKTGECTDVDGTMECQVPSGGEDAGPDASDEDAGMDEDTGSNGESGSDDASDEGCSVSSGFGAPVNTLAPLFIGLGLLAVARRRE